MRLRHAFALSIVASFAVAGCSGNPGGTDADQVGVDGGKTTSAVTIRGRASAGNIRNASVKAFCRDKGARGAELGASTTNARGEYELSLSAMPTCPVEVVVSDAGDGQAQYVEEASRNVVALGATELSALVPKLDSPEETVAITMLTHLAAAHYLAQEPNYATLSGDEIAQLMAKSNALLAGAAGLSDIVGTVPADSETTHAGATAESRRYAAFLAGLSQLALNNLASTIAYALGLLADITDGDFDTADWAQTDDAFQSWVPSTNNVTGLTAADGFTPDSTPEVDPTAYPTPTPMTSPEPSGPTIRIGIEQHEAAVSMGCAAVDYYFYDTVTGQDSAVPVDTQVTTSVSTGAFSLLADCSGDSVYWYTFPAGTSRTRLYYRAVSPGGSFLAAAEGYPQTMVDVRTE